MLDVDALYRRYGPMVLRRCRRLLGAEDRALDAMQDTFVQVIRHADRLDAEAPSSLLWRVATRVCLNLLRAARRRPEAPDGELIARIAALPSDPAARRLIDQIFAREPDSTRVIAVLHLVDGLTLEETAAEVGLSVSGVRKRLRVLKERLQLAEGEGP
ncbi:MAG: sigma-70 family RNA polymerase sigma factor [Deltaproteobacteria bacterium]|nr:sigma-70 family RNA polymerase sigma factor [Deltaproteobacteria bacterium]